MHTSSTHIGVIDPSGTIAPTLTELGFDIIGGTEFRAAATAVAEHAATDGMIPVVIVDHAATGIDVWTDATSKVTPIAVLTRADEAGPLHGRTDALRFPVTLNQILSSLGIEATAHAIGERAFDGTNVIEKTEPKTTPQNPYLAMKPASAPANPYRGLRSRADIARGITTDSPPAASEVSTPATEESPQQAPMMEQTPEVTFTQEEHSSAEEPVAGTRTAEDYDSDATYYASRAERQGRSLHEHRARATHELANVIFVASGKGGTGKSTTALQLAHYASEISRDEGAGLKVTLIDGNRGQGDLRGYLWLPDDAPLPTVYDAASKGPAAALIEPKFYGMHRKKYKLSVPDFSIMLTPPAPFATPSRTPADVYLDVIAHAREVSDLVIVDTQVLEAEKSDLWRNAFLPTLLTPRTWLVATASEAAPALNNLRLRLAELVNEHSVSTSKILLLATMFDEFGPDELARFSDRLGRFGRAVGATGYDLQVREAFNTGRIESRFASCEDTLRAILNQATGRYDLFDPIEEPERPNLLELLRLKKPKTVAV